ncbi:potassium transporter Kup [Salinisphaera orenii YIM 95161]|uniref:Probable potassium transport system protein Kup n=1 Tax=Salinisphaera orenii YIM 95161 TaxID=1051139 RepID=A0A423PMA1_9GAMM|nr:potassium transporter Kup [Salinisphaera halophila]ROO26707.1 potassium transporter Kup [Salinisphaera halophila YIM 95161]
MATENEDRSLAKGSRNGQSTGNGNDGSHAAGDDSDSGGQRLPFLCLAALGIVYGDIGTSPIYALREAFYAHDGIAVAPANIYGVLSLIFWALIIVISIKYLTVVMRAGNNGEGGIIALVALLNPWKTEKTSRRYLLMLLGLFGAALLYGDGTITPAISVLSAIEGLEVATPAFTPYVVPITIAILVGLFLIQKRGTAAVGSLFGPVMLVWFSALALLGSASIVEHPTVLAALNPAHAVQFFAANGTAAFFVLGTVFLVVTGGEALYADMGHFGITPIRIAWFGLVLPALVLNYFGQGALMLENPDLRQPFYEMAPSWGLYPLVGLATLATVIASQAVISGVFSLTRQTVQLGQLPRLNIVQTSRQSYGQIYIPAVNWILMIATIGLVIGFGSSSNLAAAYGVAVSMDMVITTILAFFVAYRWDWSPRLAGVIAAVLLVVDLAFFGANLFKVPDGGWYPLALAAAIFFLMGTWRRGRELVGRQLREDTEPLEDFIAGLDDDAYRIDGSAIFMTDAGPRTPPMLLHHLRHNRVLHEQVILLTVYTQDVPQVPAARRMEIEDLGRGFVRVQLHYGFMQATNVPVALRFASEFGLDVDLEESTFYVGRETLIPTTERPGMWIWRERLFAFMSRNANRATAYYRIPPERVVELGIQIEI